MTLQKPLKSIENDPDYIKRVFFTDESRLEINSAGRRGNKGKHFKGTVTILKFSPIMFLRQVSGIKYFNQMSTYHLACGISEIT